MKLGIFTPYNRGETTAAALSLADLALANSYSVSLLAPGTVESGIHPYWDNKVLTVRNKSPYKWARGCSQLIWLQPDAGLKRKVNLVSPNARHWYVPSWHSLRYEDYQLVQQFDRIAAPSRSVYQETTEREVVNSIHAAWCVWDSGLKPVKRPLDDLQNEYRKLYVPVDAFTSDNDSGIFLDVVEELVVRVPRLSILLDCSKSWNRFSRDRLRHIAEGKGGERLQIRYQASLLQQAASYHESGWTWIPSRQSNFAMAALRSLSCGTPVICYDIPPFNEVVKENYNGKLIGCDLDSNWLGASIAVADPDEVLRVLLRVFCDDTLCNRCRKYDWKLEERRARFERFWDKEWSNV